MRIELKKKKTTMIFTKFYSTVFVMSETFVCFL